MNKTKIIIAGGRDFTEWQFFEKWCERTICSLKTQWSELTDLQIVSGGARGTDALGEKFAKVYDIDLKIFPAEWDLHGKSAGYIRNSTMAEYADVLIAFWDGRSKGTKHMIDTANRNNLEVHVIKYD
jgi:hypothetical protein